MSIAVGSDHTGFELKEQILQYFDNKNIKYNDVGVYENKRADYADYGVKVAKLVTSGEHEFGIIVCGTGIGISISANKVRGARAALCTSDYMVEMARQHNNANIIALGGRTTTIDLAVRMIELFLNTEFEGGRHIARVDKIHSLSGR